MCDILSMTLIGRIKTMKQHEVATLAGISRSFVCQLATGARKPSIEVFARLSGRLGLDREEIGASIQEMFAGEFVSDPTAPADAPTSDAA